MCNNESDERNHGSISKKTIKRYLAKYMRTMLLKILIIIVLLAYLGYLYARSQTYIKFTSRDVGITIEAYTSQFGNRIDFGRPDCTNPKNGICRWRFGNYYSLSTQASSRGSLEFAVLRWRHKNISDDAESALFRQICLALYASIMSKKSKSEIVALFDAQTRDDNHSVIVNDLLLDISDDRHGVIACEVRVK